ncbi:hypothetical protein LTR62_007300 [Meristemomyces frigidus]|uniref:Uncharacterized protein n=1 Tax=Meristemomyces frigidus TaxID=1508187 RepID=A0AAN7TH12_9PEZI|nr:hypothetical protein LTR62_007300 [Meristemomyces frigidus]
MAKFAQNTTLKHQQLLQSGKRKVSCAGLFSDITKRQKRHADETPANSYSAVKPVEERARGMSVEEEFVSSPAAEEARHAIYAGLDNTVEKYTQGVQSSIEGLIEPVYEELDARAKGFDTYGHRIPRPGVPTPADIEALVEQDRALSRPLAEDELEVEATRSNGTKVLQRYNIKRVITAYKDLYARKRAEIESLELEIIVLDSELEQAYKEVSEEDASLGIQRAQQQWERDQERFGEASKAAKEELTREFEVARAEEKKASAEVNRKVEAFMRDFL